MCVPNTLIYFFTTKIKSKFVSIGAQNCHHQKNYGSFTGSVNAMMLKKTGARYIILGHSENRSEGETNQLIKKKIIIFISICLVHFFSNNSQAVEPDEILKNQEQELRARDISKNIRCMVCQNQSIDESNAPLAKDLRILIREKIKEGKNNDEIYEFLTDRYGDFILLNPPFKLNTLVLWFFPFIFFGIGIFIIFFHNKKSKQN